MQRPWGGVHHGLIIALLALVPMLSATIVAADAGASGSGVGILALKPANDDPFPNTIYRYRNKRGRTVFTNIPDQVPADQRDRAKVDLSHITLNPQIGAELDASMQQEFETLSATPECKEVKAQASHWLGPIWEDYGHLIILGGILLGLFLATPFALRRVEAPVWARTLTKSIMMIAFVGVFMHTSVRAGKSYEAIKRAATPCERDNWTAVAKAPDGRTNQLKVLMDLQGMIRKAQSQTDQDRLNELDKLLTQ